MGVTTQELQAILDQMNKIKEEMLQDVREKCEILGMKLVPASDDVPTPKQKRKRRTKAEIAADNAKPPPIPTNTL